MSQERRRLGDIADTFNGKTPSKADQRSNGFPVLKIKDVNEWGRFRGRFESFVDAELAQRHSARWICKGDTLILNAAHNADFVGSKIFLADDDVVGCLPTGEWLLARPKSGAVLAEYLHFWLRTDSARSMIRYIVKGIHLYPKDVAHLEVPWVPNPQQHRIVDLLSRAEGIVRLRHEAEKKAAEIIPALFLDLFGDPATNPKGWDELRLGDIAEVVSGVTKGRKFGDRQTIEVPYLRVANVQAGRLDLSEMKMIEVLPKEVAHLALQHGDVMLTEGGDFDKLGRGALWEHDIQNCIHQNHVFRVRLNQALARPEFFVIYLQASKAREYFLRSAKRTTNLASINMTQLRALPVVLPPMDLQAKFVESFEATRSIQSQQSTAAAKAQATFDALLARCFDQGIQACRT